MEGKRWHPRGFVYTSHIRNPENALPSKYAQMRFQPTFSDVPACC